MVLVRCQGPGSAYQVYALRCDPPLRGECRRAWSWSGRYGSGHAAIGRTRADAIARLHIHLTRQPPAPLPRIPS